MPQSHPAKQDATALVVGASGAIGGALVQALSQDGRYQRIYTSSRHGQNADLAIDLCDDAAMAQAASQLAEHLSARHQRLSGIYICSGLLHAEGVRPERRLESLAPQAFEQVMRINALGPLYLLGRLKGLLSRHGESRLAVVSARVGSIQDNRLGGWYSYRCSKAALNMGVRCLAVELARTHPRCVVTLFHPGTTASALSAPFQAGVEPERLFSPERAARQFCDVLRQRDGVSGASLFVDWAGEPIAF